MVSKYEKIRMSNSFLTENSAILTLKPSEAIVDQQVIASVIKRLHVFAVFFGTTLPIQRTDALPVTMHVVSLVHEWALQGSGSLFKQINNTCSIIFTIKCPFRSKWNLFYLFEGKHRFPLVYKSVFLKIPLALCTQCHRS